MRTGQCPKCNSREVFCNTNRKFPALHTITVKTGSSNNRYAPLDTFICGECGYVESYIAHVEDLSYVKQTWASVEQGCDRSLSVSPPPVLHNGSDSLPARFGDELREEVSSKVGD